MVEDFEAQPLVAAICQWWCGTVVSRRRSSNTDAAWLGFGLGKERETEGEGKPGERREELVLGLLIHARGFGLDGNDEREGGSDRASMARVGTEEDDRRFSGNPLPFYFYFYSGPFPFDFLFYYLNTAVILLFEDPNKFRKKLI